MSLLISTVIVSLDGYVRDEDGTFDWAMPDDEEHAALNDLDRPVGTHLYGRRMYEVMSAWEAMAGEDLPPVARDYADIWCAAEKIVYSTTLREPSTERTRIEHRFDPDAVRKLKADSDHDLSIGGPTLTAHAIRAGLVDEYHLFVHPVVVGGGLRALPDGVRLGLELVEERRFASGVVQLHYRNRR